eukprot:9328533-Pyramimonas_sp.AAC.1
MYLRAEPTAPVTFPTWLKQKFIQSAIAEASPEGIWRYITEDSLTDAGYGVKARQEALVLEMIKMKARDVGTAAVDATALVASLRSFVGAFPKQDLDSA